MRDVRRAERLQSFIGRSEDLGALEAALERARDGEPVALLLAGEAGIGKTRLVEEFAERRLAQARAF